MKAPRSDLLCLLYPERWCEMRKKALIIDDNEKNRMLEKDLLEAAGFEVFEVEDAVIGIAMARKEKPDIIIMDMRLPDMLGTEASKIL